MSRKNSVIQARKLVSGIIIDVLTEKTSVREAIKKFPPDIDDKSVECAFHALLHFEADEDYRSHDKIYAEEQEEYLEYLAGLLAGGEDIPANIIEEYGEYYESSPVLSKKGIMFTLKNLFRLIT